MIDLLIQTEDEWKKAVAALAGQKLPFRLVVTDWRPRSRDQNTLQWLWAKEASQQRGDVTISEVQAEWKLRFGIPILLAENATFAAVWLRIEGKLTHEEKLEWMNYIPVTSMMTMDQARRYLDDVQRYNAENKIKLTDPEESRYGPKEGSRVDWGNPRPDYPDECKAPDRTSTKR